MQTHLRAFIRKLRHAHWVHKAAYGTHAISYSALFFEAHHAYVIMGGPIALIALLELINQSEG